MTHTTRPLHPGFGLEIQGMDLAHPSGEDMEYVRRLWQDHPLLLVRRQLLTERQLMDFSAAFGKLEQVVRKDIHSRYHPEVTIISNLRDEEGQTLGGLASYDLRWHTDQSYRTRPATGAILYGLEVPEAQGDTWWANTALAHAALPAEVQEELENCQGQFAYQLYKEDIEDDATRGEIRQLTPDAVHPCVLTHPLTGGKSLYIDPTQTFALDGLPEARSAALLKEIKAHLVREEFTYKHQWQMGDVMLWDNARLLHRRDPFDGRLPRLMKRTTIFLPPEQFPVPF